MLSLRHRFSLILVPAVSGLLLSAASTASSLIPTARGAVALEPCLVPGYDGEEMLCGSYEVAENPKKPYGRRIALAIAVLPALSARPQPDPIFYFAGGPGGSALQSVGQFVHSILRRDREVVLIDQRGTGASNPLPCTEGGSSENLQGYLDGDFSRLKPLRQCKRQLQKLADLKQYVTPVAVDDIDEVRRSMGYGAVNIVGNSWGARTGIVYLRRHPESIRAAVLKSLPPLAITYPLYHARGAQDAFGQLLAACAGDAACAAAYPDSSTELNAVLEALEGRRVAVVISHPDTGERIGVELTRKAFGEGLRWLMFVAPEWSPALIRAAFAGNYEPITQFTVDYAHALGDLKLGLLLSEVCSLDVPRIDPEDIQPLTDDTFMGDTRVRELLRVCKIWPTAGLPAGYGDPVASAAPILLWSGIFDSASRPDWVEAAREHLPNSRHIVVQEAHTPGGKCVDQVTRRFLDAPDARRLNSTCVRRIALPPFVVPGTAP